MWFVIRRNRNPGMGWLLVTGDRCGVVCPYKPFPYREQAVSYLSLIL